MNKKVFGLIVTVIIACALTAVFFVEYSLAPAQENPKALDFTVSGTNDCLRFLNNTVSIAYVPLKAGANQNWQLTINSTQMPGGANGWTDVYIYKGYWDKGTNYKCISVDTYPILANIQSDNAQIRGNSPLIQNFSGPTTQSYTIFFVFPAGGQATFRVTYKELQ